MGFSESREIPCPGKCNMRAVRLSQYNSFWSVVHFRDRYDDDVYRQTAINFKLECVLLYLSQPSEGRKELGDPTDMKYKLIIWIFVQLLATVHKI